MARVTITDLQAQLAERDAEIQRLNTLLDEARRSVHEVRAAVRLIGAIVEDVQAR